MNGDTSKLSASAGHPISSESVISGSLVTTGASAALQQQQSNTNMHIQQGNLQPNEFATMNGADNDYYAVNNNSTATNVVGSVASSSSAALVGSNSSSGAAANVSNDTNDISNASGSRSPDVSAINIDQLKHSLSTQLEYYFSR